MEAQILRSKLESYGIRCMVTNAHFSTLMPVYNQMMGGMIRIYVLESDLALAQELLDEPAQKTEQLVCPECGSENVKYGLGKKKILKYFSLLLSFLVLIPLLPNLMVYRCRDCGHEFRK